MQNPTLVLGSVVAEDITDMVRFTFNIHLDAVKKCAMEISEKNGRGGNCSQKRKKYHAWRYTQLFYLGHTMVPYGLRTQRHAEGYQPEGENPQIATREIPAACTGV